MKLKPPFFFYAFSVGIFLVLISRYLLANSLFMDGIIYGAISKNIAIGNGSIWHLHFTNTYLADFHEHPPLAMYLQSFFFQWFGEGRFIEKIYGLFCYAIVALTLWKIWKQLGFSSQLGWLPLLLWWVTPVVFWACTNNVLEITMAVFTTLAVWFLLKSQLENKVRPLFFAGLMLSFAFLSKGFVGLFPFGFLFFWWVFHRQTSFIKMGVNTFLLLLFSLLPIALLYLFNADAKDSLLAYFHIQVVNSLSKITTVDSRFFIVKRLFSELLAPGMLALLMYLFTFQKKEGFALSSAQKRIGFSFLAVAFSGVLPITISMKQSGFYILCTYPLFALALGAFLHNRTAFISKSIYDRPLRWKVFRFSSVGILCLGIGLSLFFSTHYGKDETKVRDIHSLLSCIPENDTLGICPEMATDWSLHGHFQRLKGINLSIEPNAAFTYLLRLPSLCGTRSIPNNYHRVPVKTLEYELYQRTLPNLPD
jgi:4-amino-4-deoxy-L-arabinose transferase-like glycosyltransferase